ncbi:MAG: hypothetical protein N6V41_01705, partial [Candidatus Portiera aleyrodidarum]|nr:hypothetical protein [Candidatus Portiera aleyrodidarum]
MLACQLCQVNAQEKFADHQLAAPIQHSQLQQQQQQQQQQGIDLKPIARLISPWRQAAGDFYRNDEFI